MALIVILWAGVATSIPDFLLSNQFLKTGEKGRFMLKENPHCLRCGAGRECQCCAGWKTEVPAIPMISAQPLDVDGFMIFYAGEPLSHTLSTDSAIRSWSRLAMSMKGECVILMNDFIEKRKSEGYEVAPVKINRLDK